MIFAVTAVYRSLFRLLIASVGILSVLPTEAVPPAFLFWDKAQHALGFALLTLLGLLAYGRRSRGLLLGILGYGALIEFVQHFLPWRHGDLLDFLADALGVAVQPVSACTARR
jgi:VanZ family protein